MASVSICNFPFVSEPPLTRITDITQLAFFAKAWSGLHSRALRLRCGEEARALTHKDQIFASDQKFESFAAKCRLKRFA
jgi:hypothetical protein